MMKQDPANLGKLPKTVSSPRNNRSRQQGEHLADLTLAEIESRLNSSFFMLRSFVLIFKFFLFVVGLLG